MQSTSNDYCSRTDHIESLFLKLNQFHSGMHLNCFNAVSVLDEIYQADYSEQLISIQQGLEEGWLSFPGAESQ